MIEAALFVAGLAVGALAAWILAHRGAAATQREHAELQAQLAGGKALLEELRQRTTERELALQQLRSTLDAEQLSRVAAETRLGESLRSMEEQRKLIELVEARFKDAFAALSRDALKANAEEFTVHAAQRIEPLREALTRYEALILKTEESRQKDHGGLAQQVAGMAAGAQKLTQETANLASALRTPQVKGRWGELTLERAVELTGMSAHCDFETQKSVKSEAGRLRPDMIVHLPGGRSVVVDSKAPTSAFLDAVAAPTEDARREHLARHAKTVRGHMQALSGKEYWSQFDAAPDFVVLFLPGESFFAAALDHDRSLIEDGLADRVILASPTTLIALLRSVAQSWLEQKQVENSREILSAAKVLFERVKTVVEHTRDVGDGLRRATKAYNAAVTSFESRLLPAGRRLTELGAVQNDAEELRLTALDVSPRSLPDDEVKTDAARSLPAGDDETPTAAEPRANADS